MFNELIKGNAGKTTTKILATLLVLTLTFSNFAILGSYISYALDTKLDQNDSTNVENVKFDVYVEKFGQKELSADINDENLKLGIKVKVENGGVLKDGIVVLEETNFKIKENENEKTLKLANIQSGQEQNMELNIVSIKDQEFNLGLLSMLSKIKLTGKYINNNGKEINIDTTKNIKINWNTANITEENNPIKLEQNLITNKLYNIDGQEKRVIQLEVKSGIENNIYPIKNSKIEINTLNLPNNDKPEDVVVASFGTMATNGDKGINFNKDLYSYNQEEGKVVINIENSENNGNIKWTKNAEDKLIITFVYDKDVDVSNIESNVNSQINIYGAENTKLTKNSKVEIANMEEQENVITSDVEASKVIYNSKMKLGQETEYDVNYALEVGYAKVGNRIVLTNENDKLEESINTYYKNTMINKNELLKVLGQEGTLQISYLDAEGQKQEIALLNNESETDENGNIAINYSENYNALIFEITNPESEGIINILNKKEIEAVDLTPSQIASINKLNVESTLKVLNEETEVLSKKETAEIIIENPISEVELGIDNTKLSTTQNNNVNITATLKNDNVKYDLYSNPVITITMPEEIEKLEITEKPVLLNANGLEVENYEVVGNEIKIELKGEQKEYLGLNTQLLINANVKAKKLIPSLEKEIIMECVNSKETKYSQDNNYAQSNVTVKFMAEEGILLANSVTSYSEDGEEILAFRNEEKNVNIENENKQITLKGIAINNTGKELNEVIIIGKINGKFVSPINVQNAQVYYTQDDEVSKNSNFTQEFAENATGYKIVCKLEVDEIKEFTYDMIALNEENTVNYFVYTDEMEVKSPNLVLKTQKEEQKPVESNDDLLQLDVKANPQTTEKLKPGQEVVLNIDITNLIETFEEETDEEEQFIDVLDEEEFVVENDEEAKEYKEVKGNAIIFEGSLSEGIVAKQAKITTSGKEEIIDLNSNSTFTIEEKVEPKGILNIQLNLLVGEELDVKDVTSNLSAKVRTKNETGEIENESFAGEVKNVVTYSVDKSEILKDIIVPKKIELNLEETKKIEIKTEPENISLDKLEIKSEDENIAIIEDGFNVKAVSSGTTNLIVSEKEGTLSNKIEVVVIAPSNTEKDIKLDEDEEETTIKPEEQNKKQTYTISGIAWLDENEDGIIGEKEKPLNGVVVKLKDNSTGAYVKYKTGEIMAVITDANGEYKFTELESGNYTVEFDYDKNKYKLTYKTDKDSNAHLVTTDGKTTITTDALKLEDKDLKNINIGLVLNKEYDLELNKYITKVTIQNNNGTETYTYDKTNLAKVEIGAKYLSGTTAIVEYTIQIKNNGEIPAYAKTIVDYVSPEFNFSSEMNANWYQAQDKNLYNKELADKVINPGETKEVKLILTKTMTNSNAGLVNNSAEIYEDFNEYAIADKNSTPANKVQKENDYSSADIIISIKTGGPALYIGIIIISMVALGAGIYIINKKIMKRNK